MRFALGRIPASSHLRRILGLGLSGAALGALIDFEGTSARADDADEADEVEAAAELDDWAELDEVLDEDDSSERINVPTPSTPAIAPSGLPPASLAATEIAPVATDLRTDLPSEPASTRVAVPDLDGLSLYEARKQLRAVGLKMSVRDEYKEKLPREYWRGYRVRSQKIEAGTEVERGTTVRVKTRTPRSFSMGY